MSLALTAALATVGLFVGMLVCSEFGRRIGLAKIARGVEGLTVGVGASESAVFGLLGLLIAFTFSGAASRFEDRRHLITVEANAIGTAYLRIDLLPDETQPAMRELFRRYVEVRLSAYLDAPGSTERTLATAKSRLAETEALQSEIWAKALHTSKRPEASAPATLLLLPALNEMIDITTTRLMATRNHPPLIIFLLLAGLSLVGALLVGYDTSANKDRSWLHTVVFAGILSLTVYVIVDLEYPRLGLIRVDAADQVLVELRASIQ